MSDQTARRVAIQHEVAIAAERDRRTRPGAPVPKRLTRLIHAVGDVSWCSYEADLDALARALIRLQAEAQLWSESLMSEAAK